MKCHWCQKELEDVAITDELKLSKEDSPFQRLECPDTHCQLTLVKESGLIYTYTLFVDIGEQRYKVIGHNTETRKVTILMKKERYEKQKAFGFNSSADYRYRYVSMLEVKRFFKPAPNKEGVLQGDALFNKLKKLVIFS